MDIINFAYNQELAAAAVEGEPGAIAIVAENGEGMQVFATSDNKLEAAKARIEKANEQIGERYDKDPEGTILGWLEPQ